MLHASQERLPNGLKVLLLELPHVHQVSLAFMARSGPRYEHPSTNGLSHFVEHLLFRGTRTHPSSLDFHVAVERLGGEINGLTQRDALTVHMTVPPKHAATAVGLLGEVCTEPLLAGLEIERSVVIEEILDTRDGDGRELDIDTLSRRVLWSKHPMGLPVAGDVELVRGYSHADCQEHFSQIFTAGNGVLAVAGPMDQEALRSAAAAAFRNLPPGRRVQEVAPPQPHLRPPIVVQETEDSQVSVLLTFAAPPENESEFSTLMLLRRILDDGFAARLRQAICEQRGLAYALAVSIDAYRDAAALDIELSCAPEKLETAVDQIWRTLETLARTPVPEEELERAKTRHISDLEFALDDPSEITGWYAASALIDCPIDYEERLTDVMAVDPERLRRLAEQVFVPDRSLLTLVGPVEEAQLRVLTRRMRRAPTEVQWL